MPDPTPKVPVSEEAHKRATELVNKQKVVSYPPAYMEAFARFIQTTSDTITRACRMIEEGNEGDAVAELEELVLSKPDPLLIEARALAAATCESVGSDTGAKLCREGGWDNEPLVRNALAALRRGIEIGREQC